MKALFVSTLYYIVLVLNLVVAIVFLSSAALAVAVSTIYYTGEYTVASALFAYIVTALISSGIIGVFIAAPLASLFTTKRLEYAK